MALLRLPSNGHHTGVLARERDARRLSIQTPGSWNHPDVVWLAAEPDDKDRRVGVVGFDGYGMCQDGRRHREGVSFQSVL